MQKSSAVVCGISEMRNPDWTIWQVQNYNSPMQKVFICPMKTSRTEDRSETRTLSGSGDQSEDSTPIKPAEGARRSVSLTKKFVKSLFLGRDKYPSNDSSLESALKACIRLRGAADILILYLHVLFHDIRLGIDVPNYLLCLFESHGILYFLIEKHLGIKLDKNLLECAKAKICTGQSWEPAKRRKSSHTEPDDSKRLFELLISYESSFHELASVDKPFLAGLFSKLGEEDKIAVLGAHPPSPALISVRRLCNSRSLGCNQFADFYEFIGLADSGINDAIRMSTPLNHKRIRATILSSAFPEIREMIGFFYKVFPEYEFAFGRVHLDRNLYFDSPENIPLIPDAIVIYVPILSREGRYCPSGLKTHYTRRILEVVFADVCSAHSANSKQLLKRVIDAWIEESDEYFKAFLSVVGAPTHFSLFPYLAENLRTLGGRLHQIISIGKESANESLFLLAEAVISMHRTVENMTLLEENIAYFHFDVNQKYKKYLDIIYKMQ